MEAVANRAAVASRQVRGRGETRSSTNQWRIDENWSEPVSEAGAALMESFMLAPPAGDQLH
eukprot:2816360-Alexandrium_andersonii.AAC.1